MSIIKMISFQIFNSEPIHCIWLLLKISSLHLTAHSLTSTGRENPRNKTAPSLAPVKNRYFQFKSHYLSKSSCRSNIRVAQGANNTSSSSENLPRAPHCVILFTLTFTSFNFNSSGLHFPFGQLAL